MRIGFFIGVIVGIWLTLSYPDQMADAFSKLTDFLQGSSSSKEITPQE